MSSALTDLYKARDNRNHIMHNTLLIKKGNNGFYFQVQNELSTVSVRISQNDMVDLLEIIRENIIND